jgi:hypothetical protein
MSQSHLGLLCLVGGEREELNVPMIRSQLFDDFVPLDGELSVSQFTYPSLGGAGWLRFAGVGCLAACRSARLRYNPSRRNSGKKKFFLLRAGFV